MNTVTTTKPLLSRLGLKATTYIAHCTDSQYDFLEMIKIDVNPPIKAVTLTRWTFKLRLVCEFFWWTNKHNFHFDRRHDGTFLTSSFGIVFSVKTKYWPTPCLIYLENLAKHVSLLENLNINWVYDLHRNRWFTRPPASDSTALVMPAYPTLWFKHQLFQCERLNTKYK